MSTDTLVKTDNFAVTPFGAYSSWLDVTFLRDGHVACAELQYAGEDFYWVWGVKVVDEEARGNGLGTALMASLAAYADREQWDLLLKCESYLVGFYERSGFHVTRTEGTVAVMERRAA